MAGVECPKCGRATKAGAIICPGCDFILDASFLGDDITDDERDARRSKPVAQKGTGPSAPPRIDFGEDAMILGKLDDAEVSSFHSRDAGVSQREVTQTRFYIGGAVAQLMEPLAIPELAGGVGGASIRMTPFERHVMTFVNGRRSIGRILKKSGMDETEFKTAVAMLADKGFIRLKGWKKPRANGHSTIGGGSRTGSMLVGAPHEAERTIIASMSQLEAAARSNVSSRRSARPARPSTPKSISGLPSPALPATRAVAPAPPAESRQPPPTSPPSPPPAPVAPPRGPKEQNAPTRVVPPAEPARERVAVLSGRFASLRAEVPSASEGSNTKDRPPTAPLPAADRWEQDDNKSSVFADSAADSAARQRAEILAVLNEATGLGDALAPSHDGGAVGLAEADDEQDEPPFASAEALSGAFEDERAAAGVPSDGPLSNLDVEVEDARDAGRIHDVVTAPPGQKPVDSATLSRKPNANDDGPSHTRGLDARRPITLPPSALAPIEPAAVPATPMPPVAATPATLKPPVPAPATVKPAPVAPTTSPASTTSPAASPAPDLRPEARPSGAKAPPPPRVSASSQVSFELRKKAERIYEQALKDHAEGRISSALMNARLAMNFDPTVETYRTLHEELSRQKVAPNKATAGARPQELVLFEQASEAEGRGEYTKAVALLEQAIAINPRAAALYNRLGVLLSIRLKRHEEALAHLKKAVELEPGSVVYMNNYSKVTGLLESLIQKAPRKKGGAPQDDRVAVKKIRPKIF